VLTEEKFRPHILQILLQYLVAFQNYNYLNLNVHFQSQQVPVIKLYEFRTLNKNIAEIMRLIFSVNCLQRFMCIFNVVVKRLMRSVYDMVLMCHYETSHSLTHCI